MLPWENGSISRSSSIEELFEAGDVNCSSSSAERSVRREPNIEVGRPFLIKVLGRCLGDSQFSSISLEALPSPSDFVEGMKNDAGRVFFFKTGFVGVSSCIGVKALMVALGKNPALFLLLPPVSVDLDMTCMIFELPDCRKAFSATFLIPKDVHQQLVVIRGLGSATETASSFHSINTVRDNFTFRHTSEDTLCACAR